MYAADRRDHYRQGTDCRGKPDADFQTGFAGDSKPAGFLLPSAAAAPLRALAGEGPLETPTVRFVKIPGICIAPQYVAEELLRAEGLPMSAMSTRSRRAPRDRRGARGDADFTLNFARHSLSGSTAETPIPVLAGVDIGCFELFGNEDIRSVTDLKGKSVGVQRWVRASMSSRPRWQRMSASIRGRISIGS